MTPEQHLFLFEGIIEPIIFTYLGMYYGVFVFVNWIVRVLLPIVQSLIAVFWVG